MRNLTLAIAGELTHAQIAFLVPAEAADLLISPFGFESEDLMLLHRGQQKCKEEQPFTFTNGCHSALEMHDIC
ncbi:hypothetical protein NPIL_325751 [Nephila pilipes]|uniref:Uncharacterized protein n=1 Tax=Nephila pilipes TaxID=299642 RepID=A0A8X6TNC9_NEPPI|nr:hypothetical protein NPIL_325751 [Nephila pilipes]